ncbi:MAG: hypothetical protein IPG89_18620 [Bacteroidetes bacterium]|nr:hypothetical protein [Bacteroidota bacterium]
MNLTINLGATYDGNGKYFATNANFTNNGTVSNLRFSFNNSNTIIASSSILNVSVCLINNSTISLASGTQMNVPTAGNFQLGGSAIFNNNGTLVVGTIFKSSGAPSFNNLNGGILSLSSNLPSPITLNSSANSTINLLSGVTSIPNWS